ncbi:MAG: adaptor protein MecA [Lachnospiraceae bacterium]
MKLERLSENQIRCTLNKADLADRELMLTELAYGTDKAKELFRDMMEQASEELGFEVNDIPLMIEAIPVSPECLILIITKVEDPEELDTRFSRFSKYTDIDIEDSETSDDAEELEDDHIDLLNNASTLMETISDIIENIEQVKRQGKIKSDKSKTEPEEASFKPLKENTNVKKTSPKKETELSYRIFSFTNINEISKAASMIVNIFEDDSILYKSPTNNHYYLLICSKGGNTENYQKVCNCLSEYGSKVKSNYATPFYFFEHYKVIIKENAIETLANL